MRETLVLMAVAAAAYGCLRGGDSRAASVYRCEIAGVATYSDRPCGEQAEPYEPKAERVSTYAAPPVAQTAPRQAAQPPRRPARGSIAADQAKRAEECRKITASLREIRSKMRSGYDAKEGERLNARQAKLNERRRAQRCR